MNKLNRKRAEVIIASAPEHTRPAVTCALVGHSRAVHLCFGQVTCGRCKAIIGDTLAGSTDLGSSLLIGCPNPGCDWCSNAASKLTWKDTIHLPASATEFISKVKGV